MEVLPLGGIPRIELLQGGKRIPEVLPDIHIQFFGSDNEIVQLFIIHLVGNLLQAVIVPVLQFL